MSDSSVREVRGVVAQSRNPGGRPEALQMIEADSHVHLIPASSWGHALTPAEARSAARALLRLARRIEDRDG